MSTLREMVDEVLSDLRSYVRDQELSTHLTAGITASDTSIPVGDASFVSRGRIQIDDELIWVDSSDRQTKIASVPPYGRGMDSSVAATHASGARVIVAPLYPRVAVVTAINNAIKAVGATLFGVATIDIDPVATMGPYEMPATTQEILSIQVVDPDSSTSYYMRDYDLDKNAPIALSTTGKLLKVFGEPHRMPQKLHVTYSTDPIPLASASSNFTDSLLPSTCEDVIKLHATSRLLSKAEAYNLQTRSIEANSMDSKIQPGAGLQQSKYLYAQYKERLQEEAFRLLQNNDIRTHYGR